METYDILINKIEMALLETLGEGVDKKSVNDAVSAIRKIIEERHDRYILFAPSPHDSNIWGVRKYKNIDLNIIADISNNFPDLFSPPEKKEKKIGYKIYKISYEEGWEDCHVAYGEILHHPGYWCVDEVKINESQIEWDWEYE